MNSLSVDLTHPKVDTGFREWFHLLKPRTSTFFSVASSHNSITEISIFLLTILQPITQPSSLFSSAELYYDWLKKKLKAKLSQLQTLYSIQPNLTLKAHFKAKIDSSHFFVNQIYSARNVRKNLFSNFSCMFLNPHIFFPI